MVENLSLHQHSLNPGRKQNLNQSITGARTLPLTNSYWHSKMSFSSELIEKGANAHFKSYAAIKHVLPAYSVSFTGTSILDQKNKVGILTPEDKAFHQIGGVGTVIDDFTTLFDSPSILPYYNGQIRCNEEGVPSKVSVLKKMNEKGDIVPIYTKEDLTKRSVDSLKPGEYTELELMAEKKMEFAGVDTPIAIYKAVVKGKTHYMVYTDAMAAKARPYGKSQIEKFSNGSAAQYTSGGGASGVLSREGEPDAAWCKAFVELLPDLDKYGYKPEFLLMNDAQTAYVLPYIAKKVANGDERYKSYYEKIRCGTIVHNGGAGYQGITSAQNLFYSFADKQQIDEVEHSKNYIKALKTGKSEEFFKQFFPDALDSEDKINPFMFAVKYAKENQLTALTGVSQEWAEDAASNYKVTPGLTEHFRDLKKIGKFGGILNGYSDASFGPFNPGGLNFYNINGNVTYSNKILSSDENLKNAAINDYIDYTISSKNINNTNPEVAKKAAIDELIKEQTVIPKTNTDAYEKALKSGGIVDGEYIFTEVPIIDKETKNVIKYNTFKKYTKETPSELRRYLKKTNALDLFKRFHQNVDPKYSIGKVITESGLIGSIDPEIIKKLDADINGYTNAPIEMDGEKTTLGKLINEYSSSIDSYYDEMQKQKKCNSQEERAKLQSSVDDKKKKLDEITNKFKKPECQKAMLECDHSPVNLLVSWGRADFQKGHDITLMAFEKFVKESKANIEKEKQQIAETLSKSTGISADHSAIKDIVNNISVQTVDIDTVDKNAPNNVKHSRILKTTYPDSSKTDALKAAITEKGLDNKNANINELIDKAVLSVRNQEIAEAVAKATKLDINDESVQKAVNSFTNGENVGQDVEEAVKAAMVKDGIDVATVNVNETVKMAGNSVKVLEDVAKNSVLVLGGDIDEATADGKRIKELAEKLIEDPDLQGRIVFMKGFAPNKPLASAASQLMIPSRFAPCELVDLEAMLFGAPPNGTNTQGIKQKNYDPRKDNGRKPTSLRTEDPYYISEEVLEKRRPEFLTKYNALVEAEKSKLIGWYADPKIAEKKAIENVKKPHAGDTPPTAYEKLLRDTIDNILVEQNSEMMKIRSANPRYVEDELAQNGMEAKIMWKNNESLNPEGISSFDLYKQRHMDNTDVKPLTHDIFKYDRSLLGEEVESLSHAAANKAKESSINKGKVAALATLGIAALGGIAYMASKSSKKANHTDTTEKTKQATPEPAPTTLNVPKAKDLNSKYLMYKS